MPAQTNETSFEYIKKIVLQRYSCNGLVFDEHGASQSPVLKMRGSEKVIVMPPFLGGIDLQSALQRQDAGLRMIPSDDFVKNITGESTIPIFTTGNGHVPEKLICHEENEIKITFDLLGTVFFILTRMEEIKSPVQDRHGRFPASSSHAFQKGYLQRPVVDEFMEVLWHCIKGMWHSALRKEARFQIIPSHDVDIPFVDTLTSPKRWLRSMAGDVLKRRNYRRVFKRISSLPAICRGDFRRDENYTFGRIMDLSEKYGLKSAFYFFSDCTNSLFDGGYPLDHVFLRSLLRDINVRGHEIGLHTSYETFKDSVQTRIEFEILCRVCEEEGISQKEWGGRQHCLRWKVPVTWRNWAEAGLDYDSSLSFADCAGFRCGTCYEFPVFDLELEMELPLRERPLIVMEVSLFEAHYMGLDVLTAVEKALILKRACEKYRGQFSLLWHNSNFHSNVMWEIYEYLLTD